MPRSEAVAGEVLAVQDLQGLLQRLDLLLACGHLVLVGLAGGDALGLQLLVVPRKTSVETASVA